MRAILAVLALAAGPLLPAQTWYVPDGNAAVGNCNVIPFGSPQYGITNTKYQAKASAADLGSLPGLITGLGFAPCATGAGHCDFLEIVLDHHPAGVPLGTNFAANLSANPTAVLAAADYTWLTVANAWTEVGLQRTFAYNGVDDLLIQVTCIGGNAPFGFRRDVRQRVSWAGASGNPPAVGSTANAALKLEVGMVMARTSRYGVGCPGPNGVPAHGITGLPQLLGTIGLQVGNGPAASFGLVVMGFYSGIPYPRELGAIGMPGCYQSIDVGSIQLAPLDAAGTGTVPLAIPNDVSLRAVKLYSQFACYDPAANPTGLTTTNYCRILIGD